MHSKHISDATTSRSVTARPSTSIEAGFV